MDLKSDSKFEIRFKIGFEIGFEIRFKSKNRKETEEVQIEKMQNEKKEVNGAIRVGSRDRHKIMQV